MYLQPTIVLDKAELPELVHKEADAGPGRPYHFRERPLAYFRDDGFRPSSLPKFAVLVEGRRASRFSLELNKWSVRSASTRLLRVNR